MSELALHALDMPHISSYFFTIPGRRMCVIIVMAAVLHTIMFHISYTNVPAHSHKS